jgi:hypothetical protein
VKRTLWTVGYGAWPTASRAERLVACLRDRGITRLVDVRLNPCAADVRDGRYGPKPWTLQTGRSGIAALLDEAGIAYEWLVELGNPQRHDRRMQVLRDHLASPGAGWPVHRGLDRLQTRVDAPAEVVALLCACAGVRECHRTVVAQALAARGRGDWLTVRDVATGREIGPDAPG